MKLKIRNFAKIFQADIEIDGITIIAGNNNTGKSTVGKILDTICNATNNIDKKMNDARIDSLASMLRKEIEGNREKLNNIRVRHYPFLIYREFAKALLESEEDEKEKVCKEYESRMNMYQNSYSSFCEKVLAYLDENMQISDDILERAIYTNYFGESFHEQINSLYKPETVAELTLSIKGKNIKLQFVDNECIQEIRQLEMFNNSLYIDDPFILDEINNNSIFGISDFPINKKNILQRIMYKDEKAVEDKTFSSLLVANKLEDIMKIINCVAAGKITKKQKYMYQLEDDPSKELDVASLSTGLKSFLILKQLLQSGNLQDKDIIILDEPEIHLHPEWQLFYAEIIVLLKKKFNFHIIVNTHSAHFMEALDLYSKKHGISERCNYYLTSIQAQGAVFDNVTEDISKIYRQMVDPTLLLSQLREELETEDDEL